MSDRRLSPLDAVWLLMESRDTPMHVGALAIFRKPAKAPADYLRRWLRRLRADGAVVAPWNVITSYSIHYTKLYEWRVVNIRPTDFAAIRALADGSYNFV